MPEARTVFSALDAKDADRLAALFAEDGRLVIGNAEPMIGRDTIRAGNAAFFSMVQGSRHVLLHEWTIESVTIAELEVTYTRLDGKEVAFPAVSIWELDDAGLIRDYRVFADQTALFAS